MGSLRESLLDRFPLRSEELDRLLHIFDACKTRLRDEKLLLSSCLPKEDDTDIIIGSVEREILPEFSQTFQHEYLDALVVGVSQHQPELYETAKFLETCITLLGRSSEKALAVRLYKTLGNDCSPLRVSDFLIRLAKAAYMLHFRSLPTQVVNVDRLQESFAESLSNLSSGNTTSNLSQEKINAWLEGQAKHAARLLSTVFHFALLGDTLSGTNLQKDSFSNPRYMSSLFDWITGCERQNNDTLNSLSGFWKYPFDPVPFHLSIMGLGGPWFQKNRRLYNSDEDGLAFSSFAHALESFMGPTLVLIRTTENEVLGFYTELPWKKGPKWYTANVERSSLLFRIQPSWTCYNMVPQGDSAYDGELSSQKPYDLSSKFYHQFMSTPVSYRRGQGPLEGLAIGGIGADAPRLHLNPTLEGCYAGSMDIVFEPGSLLDNERTIDTFFDVDALEVWAIRSKSFCKDLAAGKINESVRESTRLQIAQVDKRQFVEDFAGMTMSDLYRHRDQSWGQADFNFDEA